MNLVLDFGNTRIKAGVFNAHKELVTQFVFASELELLAYLPQLPAVSNCIVASVTSQHETTFQRLSHKVKTLLFMADTPIPLTNLYKSANTLGSDRLAASVGAFIMHPNQNVLTIDAGTCIKYNFVNSQNQYLGGAISPGITMRLNAMNHFTHALPLVDKIEDYDVLVGTSTSESLLSGAMIGAACEIDGVIGYYREQYSDLIVMLTGGDMTYLCKQVKSRLFASQNLLLTGLNAILQFNLEK